MAIRLLCCAQAKRLRMRIYDPKTKQLNETSPPANAKELEQRALANALLPDLLYNEQRYRLPQ